MNTSPQTIAGHRKFHQILEIDMDAKHFGSDWAHCDQISTYASRMIGHNRKDPHLFSNLFSSAFNEVLEAVFYARAQKGNLVCRFQRSNEIDRIELTIPLDRAAAESIQEAIDLTYTANAEDVYLEKLLAMNSPDGGLGLLELAVDYNANLSMRKMNDDKISLIVDLVLEEPEH